MIGRLGWLVVALGLLSCRQDVVRDCPVSASASGTCAEACDNMKDLDCRPGSTQDECVAACEAASANVPEDVLGRVLSCYATVDSCREVDGCSRACGEGDGPVPWNLDAGIEVPDAGVDAGPDGG